MKKGRSLTDLAAELERQANTKRDFIAETQALEAVVIEDDMRIAGLPGGDAFGVTDYAHGQIASELAIPKPYYDRMRRQAPDLLVQNVNGWFRKEPKRRMVRTLDQRVRAFVSDAYRPLDNFALAEAIFPVLADLKGLEVGSCELTETRMYIKIVYPSLAWDLAMAKREAMQRAGIEVHTERPGEDVVQAAIVIVNSEVGCGALSIEEALHRLVCYNLATIIKAVRKYHVGKRHGNGDDGFSDEVRELLSTEARVADDRAFFLKVRDVVKGALTEARFRKNAERFAEAAGDRITAPVEDVVERVAEVFSLSDGSRKGVLHYLAEGGDLSRYGLINAITRASQDSENYDEASELERLGGKVLELPKQEWKRLGQLALAA